MSVWIYTTKHVINLLFLTNQDGEAVIFFEEADNLKRSLLCDYLVGGALSDAPESWAFVCVHAACLMFPLEPRGGLDSQGGGLRVLRHSSWDGTHDQESKSDFFCGNETSCTFSASLSLVIINGKGQNCYGKLMSDDLLLTGTIAAMGTPHMIHRPATWFLWK